VRDKKMKKNPRAFIVDDDKDTLVILTFLFESLGIDVVQVNDSKKALSEFLLSSLNSGKFDIVVLDIKMPYIDGNELARQIKSKGYCGKIIALTASVTVDGRRESRSIGFDYYLGKKELTKEVIRAILNNEDIPKFV
jgi:CheY-like chemotaxis protein